MAIVIQGMTPLIQVFNMPRALVFYRDILGFEIVTDSGNCDDSSWVWLRLNGSDIIKYIWTNRLKVPFYFASGNGRLL